MARVATDPVGSGGELRTSLSASAPVHQLKGKLLRKGVADENVPPDRFLQFVKSLIQGQ